MGSSNRDYMQDEYETGGPSWLHDAPTTKWLLIITVAVFFLQTVLTHSPREMGGSSYALLDGVFGSTAAQAIQSVAFHSFNTHPSYIEDWLPLSVHKVFQGQIWRLVTFIFCHDRDNPFNVVFNMVALWYLGSTLERMYGSRELLWFYLVSGLVCGLVFTAFGMFLILPVPLMGSNACVMALLTLYATHFPRQEILFCWIVPIQIRVLLFIYIALDVYWILQAYSGRTPWLTVAYSSEIANVAFAYLYYKNNWRLGGLSDVLNVRNVQRSMRRASTARRLKVFQPESTSSLDEQVDAILAKIHEQGSESLTDRERSILQRASEQAKDRR